MRLLLDDDGMDELAAAANSGAPFRVAITCGTGLLCLNLLPTAACLAWICGMALGELLALVTTRRQARGEVAGPGLRAAYAMTLLGVSLGWMGLGAMLWATGAPQAAVCAGVIWLSVVFFAQTFAYQSPVGLIMGGALPALSVMAFLLLGPDPLNMRWSAVWGVFGLSLLFAADGAIRMLRAHKRFDDARAGLEESEARYRMLSDNLTDVIALSEVDGRRIYISPSVERAMGYSAQELLRTPMNTYLHPDDAWLGQKIANLEQDGGQATYQYRVLHRNGAVVWSETNFCLIQTDDPETPKRMVSVSRDITTRKALETELVEARRRAEEAAAAKSDFLANMTHELRTPLNAIIGFSGVLKGSAGLNARDSRHVHLIDEASNALLELVNSVLDFSRLDAGAVEIEARPFDPLAPVQAMCALMTAQAEAKGVKLLVRSEGELSPLLGDGARIRQVLLNFLSNALKFTDRGAITVMVSQTDAPADCSRLRVAVTDTGIGLREDQIEHLFDRFTQADASVSRQYGGTGLGLAICKRTVELMGGTLGVESEPGEGSTFWFELVLPRTDEAPADVAEIAAPEDFERPLRVLLAEDVAVNRELITTLLAPFSLEIVTAENGEQAVVAMRQDRFDLVLMDVQMPVMDGLAATRLIRDLPDAHARATPIIAMTANVLPEQVAVCREAGMDDHLGKPISPARLLEALAYWSTHDRGEPREDARASA